MFSLTEQLESRFLLSFASLSAHGTLSIVGGSKNDTITVQIIGSKAQAILNGQTETFNKSDVKRLWIDGFGGDDVLKNATSLPATLIGSDGKDRLVAGSAGQFLVPGDMSGQENVEGDVIDYSDVAAGTFNLNRDGAAMDRAGGVEDAIIADVTRPLSFQFTPGSDYVILNSVMARWSYHTGSGNDTIQLISSSCAETDGQDGNDLIILDENSFINTILGGNGDDTFIDNSGAETAANVDLGSGYDTWVVTPVESFYGGNIYSQTVAPGVEKFVLDIVAPARIAGNSLNNDIEISSSGGATVSGEAGNDLISVDNEDNFTTDSRGVAFLNGDAGSDTLIGDTGTDIFSGGSGTDTADFSARTDNLNITLDNIANDGLAGEKSNVMADIENIIGGSGNDLIVGNPFNNKLVGNAGNDTIFGGAGNDTLEGDAGHDQLFGQDGNDLLLGKDGQKDTLDGGNGIDTAQRDHSSSVNDVVESVESFI